MTFDMRTLPVAATALGGLNERELRALRFVADGLSAREIADRLDLPEADVYLFVARVIEELQPAPDGDTMHDVHARHGTRPASPSDVQEFERRFGPSPPPDDEG